MGDNVFINICFSILVIIILVFIIRVLILKKKIKNINRLQKEINILGDDISLLQKNKETYKYALDETIRLLGKGDRGNILIKNSDGTFKCIAKMESEKYKNKKIFDVGDVKKYKNISILNRNILNIGTVLVSPLKYHGDIIALIKIESLKLFKKFNEEDVIIMKQIRHEFEVAIRNYIAQEKLKYIATHDELTDLYNRRYFNEIFEEQLKLMSNKKSKGYLVVIDLDNFKIINDSYGHVQGDRAIMAMADAMRDILDVTDTYARMSGDEFIIIFRNNTYEEVEEKLIKIRKKIRESRGDLEIDFTYGIAAINYEETLDKDELFANADKAMYDNKKIKKVGR
ncbi:sensor domain-containing diguanylate cyclase [uncultured Clostridium sp.]|uniref:GGDEF domain-containing protein n=1 Tax=uncultured Clostridium sp. TaxID=59620 RepID=UPI0025FD3C7A|nr:sensor domain-containing diguanylate cyclase [uncultured Clostridium sp.]